MAFWARVLLMIRYQVLLVERIPSQMGYTVTCNEFVNRRPRSTHGHANKASYPDDTQTGQDDVPHILNTASRPLADGVQKQFVDKTAVFPRYYGS